MTLVQVPGILPPNTPLLRRHLPPTPSLSLTADAVPQGTSSTMQASMSADAEIATPTSDPSSSTAATLTSDISADVDMMDASSSSTSITPSASTSTFIPSGPPQMHQKDLL